MVEYVPYYYYTIHEANFIIIMYCSTVVTKCWYFSTFRVLLIYYILAIEIEIIIVLSKSPPSSPRGSSQAGEQLDCN